MVSVINQTRGSFPESMTRDKRESFRDKKPHDNDSIDSEHVMAIAAAAFVVHSFEEKMNTQHQKKEKTREQVEASMRTRMSRGDHNAPSFARASKPRDQPYANRNLSIHGSGNPKLDAWEKAELLKIQRRYDKSNLTILEWENEKKIKAKRRVEEKQKEMDERRSIIWQHYKNKLARIEHVAGGARSQAEKNKRKEEQKIKERAKEMRSLGVSSPKYCFLC